jgi:hypothetical protein
LLVMVGPPWAWTPALIFPGFYVVKLHQSREM